MSACNCCSYPYGDYFQSHGIEIRPTFASEFATAEKVKCAFKLEGGEYSQIENTAFCFEDPSQESTRTQTLTEVDGICTYNSEYNPPISSWTGFCGFSSIRQKDDFVGFGEVSDESLKADVFELLENAEFFSSGLGLAQAWYAVNPQFGNQNFPTSGFAGKEQYKIKHLPSPSCYLKVWIGLTTFSFPANELSSPNLYSLVDDSTAEYIWSPSYSPCLPDPTKSAFAEENIIESETYFLDPSEDNQITFAYIKKYSFLPDYEPNDPLPFNPETQELLRPDPDINPNGVGGPPPP